MWRWRPPGFWIRPGAKDFDRITRLAARALNAPIALLSLIDKDRQWFKSSFGVTATEYPRCYSLCARMIVGPGPIVVPDASLDERFACNPLVTGEVGVRMYAAAPLVVGHGHAIGALCVFDTVPREFSADDLAMLVDLAAMAVSEIELYCAVGRRDVVSGLPNRSEHLHDVAAAGENGEARVAVVVDLGNDVRLTDLLATLGPDRKDELVRAGAAAIVAALPTVVQLYHVGTMRFACMLPEAGHSAVLSRLADALQEPVLCGSVPVFLDAAIGAVPHRPALQTPADMLRLALAAAQRSREEGVSGSWSLYDCTADRAHRRAFQLLTDLRPALTLAASEDAERPARPIGELLEAPQLRLQYQPRMDLRTGLCRGVEALLRWEHPTLGGVAPGEFIPLVEKTALPRAMTAWVLESALRDAAKWRRAGLDVNMSVNVCALNMDEPDFATRVAAALARHGLPARMLELELTERALLHGVRLRRTVQDVTALGVTLSIDDFGTGYSNLAYLRKIPACVLKLDRSFIGTLPHVARDRTIVRALIGMAHDLGYRVVAEGVETQETLALLQEWDCDEAQGFLFSAAMPAEDLPAWMATRQLASPAAA